MHDGRSDLRRRLVPGVAMRSIRAGLRRARPLEVHPAAYPEALREHRATFVTLRLHGELRGCIGSLEATRPLVVGVAENAVRTAFHDPRFDPVTAPEIAGLAPEISILSPLVPLEVSSEEALLAALRPGIDGLLLRNGTVQATFLPAVWESLSEPELFVRELRRKAGIPASGWPPTLEAKRYTVECF